MMNAGQPQHTIIEDIYEKSAFYRWLALIGGVLAWTFDGVEQGVYSIMSRDALKDLIPSIHEKVNQLTALKAIAVQPGISEQIVSLTKEIDTAVGPFFSLALALWLWGAACGGVFFGRMGDKYGRVRSLIFAVITYSLFTGLSALSGDWTHLAACRFLGALGLGGAWPLSVALIVETWPDKYRSVLAGLMGMGANIGFLIASLYAGLMLNLKKSYPADYGWIDWRWVIGMGFFIGMSSLLLIVFIPEPTKWREAKAKKQKSSLRELFTPRYRRATIVGSCLSTIALLGTWGSFLWLATYIDQIAEGTDYQETAKTIASRWQSYGQIFGGFVGGVLAGWLGNKMSWNILCITAWASVLALFGLNHHFGLQVLFMGTFAGFFVTAFFGWLPKYLPELYPTRIRATGQGFAFNIGRIIAGFGVLGTGLIVNIFHGDYAMGAMCMCCIYLLGIIAIQFAPNTGGKMAEEEE